MGVAMQHWTKLSTRPNSTARLALMARDRYGTPATYPRPCDKQVDGEIRLVTTIELQHLLAVPDATTACL